MDRVVVSRMARPGFESQPHPPLGNLHPAPRALRCAVRRQVRTAGCSRCPDKPFLGLPMHTGYITSFRSAFLYMVYRICIQRSDTSINLEISPVDVPFLLCLKVCRVLGTFCYRADFPLVYMATIGASPDTIPLLPVRRMRKMLSKLGILLHI